VNPGRDFKVDEWIDVRVITMDDPCPKCGRQIELKEAIEVGHTFKLGTKYSESLNAKYLDEKGKEKLAVMGCYGIGVNRILAALIENSHDKDGIIWPASLAPCQVVVIPVTREDKKLVDESEKIYDELKGSGIDVILDDREKTAGVKFKDADLVGFPTQVVVGKKNLDQGKIEIKNRATGKKTMVSRDKVLESVNNTLGEQR
jgi:prolyl-tRNA synthetase